MKQTTKCPGDDMITRRGGVVYYHSVNLLLGASQKQRDMKPQGETSWCESPNDGLTDSHTWGTADLVAAYGCAMITLFECDPHEWSAYRSQAMDGLQLMRGASA